MNARKTTYSVILLLASIFQVTAPPPIAGQAMRRVLPVEEGQRSLGLGFNPQDPEPAILSVDPGSLAEQAGLRVGDIVESLNGRPIGEHGDSLLPLIRGSQPLAFLIRRGDERLTLTVGEPEPNGVSVRPPDGRT